MTAPLDAGRSEERLRGRVVTPEGVLHDGLVVLHGDRISWVGPVEDWPHAAPPPSGRTLLPGLVDVHCHGGAGHGFGEVEGDGPLTAVRYHRNSGSTTVLASLVSAPVEVLLRQVEALAGLVAAGELAGIHLEGPFLSPAFRGAHDPAALLPGDPDVLEAVLLRADGVVRSMTLAPEVPRSDELVAVLRRYGVLPCLGHTGADAGQATRWMQSAGTPVGVTHLFNGMPSWHHRAAGPVAACLAAAARGTAVVELIADGVHVDDETVAAVFDLVGPRQIALVTDSTAAAGMPDGSYRLGSRDVSVAAGVARLAPDGTGKPGPIAGGTFRLLDVLRRTVLSAGVELLSAVTSASRTPATLLGLDGEVGALEAGRRADVLVVDGQLHAVAVVRGGRRVAGSDPGPEEDSWRS
ncbi:N-acetylglucosamine-6-phosphate deacetylase [Blastococcus aurantiacus]|uniref:N-acetylglucosamine-6-phosphate deacetylase n=1 Tax=Blastococcus aurantiacus TaxID=1550231 RepID=A0A1G7NRA8_9ACTN|nr:amidohydrolase family protein [Blastococcus aurantiacus]SDF76584.1 N-acetylglucosamine-6-phosphate deacetylase [Blastococcus aurantiacus]